VAAFDINYSSAAADSESSSPLHDTAHSSNEDTQQCPSALHEELTRVKAVSISVVSITESSVV
jgi:hypothetical protein